MKRLAEAIRKSLAAGIIAAWLIAGAASGGYAENQAGDPVRKEAAEQQAVYEIEELIVTAQKREESFQDVPISITGFTGMQLEDAGIDNTLELAKQVPNVYLKHAEPENTIIIRGVTSFHSSIYAPAGFYVDDVNYPLQYMHNAELFDVERVEVLKGPQGTLYGRNAESGVINVITRQPGNEFKGKIVAEYGNYDSSRVGASFSGPLIEDRLFLGVAVQKKDSDGYYTNAYDDDDEISDVDHLDGRATLRWKPSERWDVSLIADMLDHEDGYGLYRFMDGTYQTGRHDINVDYPDNYMDQKGDGQTLKVKYRGDSFDFLSVTGNRSYERKLGGDRDGTPNPGNYFRFSWDDEMQSQEFRFSSNDPDNRFQWLFGLYGFVEEVKTRNNMEHLAIGPLWDNRTRIDVEGYAAFTQLTCTLWDRLHLTAGLRADHHDLEGELTGTPSYLTPAGQELADDLDYDEVLPKFALSYDVTDDIMCYATAAKGYLIGGYNYVSAYSQQAFTYDSEYTWNYEIGVKTSWFDRRLLLNASFFYIDIKDKQVFEIDQTVPIPGAQNIRNAAEAHSAGCEIELRARPFTGLDIFAGFGFTEAKIDEWIAEEADGTTYDYKDKYLTYYPRDKFNIGIQYRLPSGWFARLDFINTGKSYCDSKNLIKQDAYQEVNLRLGYESEHFDVVLWGENIFDEKYFTYMTHYGPDTLVVDGKPMTYGATVTYRF
jgi:iron complex outermembrane receptor protein